MFVWRFSLSANWLPFFVCELIKIAKLIPKTFYWVFFRVLIWILYVSHVYYEYHYYQCCLFQLCRLQHVACRLQHRQVYIPRPALLNCLATLSLPLIKSLGKVIIPSSETLHPRLHQWNHSAANSRWLCLYTAASRCEFVLLCQCAEARKAHAPSVKFH